MLVWVKVDSISSLLYHYGELPQSYLEMSKMFDFLIKFSLCVCLVQVIRQECIASD